MTAGNSNHLLAGEGFKSSSSYVEHVGLGDALQADLVTVTWPAGGHFTYVAAIQANETLRDRLANRCSYHFGAGGASTSRDR
ncbi:MAG: ASPIC/UnbV domain-containing protein [Planctomycetes bacterium]|nr:ASPIC/UnbV domain-containing protein [Planctomycetota bacterium]